MTKSQRDKLLQKPATAGNRLDAAFDIDGRSQMDCARATGLTPQYVSDMRRGRYANISLDNARKFATFFGCLIEDLFPSTQEVA